MAVAAALGGLAPALAASHLHSRPAGSGATPPDAGRNLLPFGDSLPPGDNRSAPPPPVAHYMSVEGQSFVFDRMTSAPDGLLKFDGDPEVWVLHPSPAPRGGAIYRDDADVEVLTITRLGGVTLFTPEDPAGVPVAALGEADGLTPGPAGIPFGALLQRDVQASARSTRAAGRLITFDAPFVTPQTSPLFSDAFSVAADAIVRLSERADARAFLAKLDRVLFVMGDKPNVSVSGSVMTVTLAPAKGFAGRPSSDRIVKAALKR
jgi:hypothetical protein